MSGPLSQFHLRGGDGGKPIGGAAEQLWQLHHIRLPASVDKHPGEGRGSGNLADQPVFVGGIPGGPSPPSLRIATS